MADFEYECINRQGEIIKGKITAISNQAAIAELKKMGFMVSDLRETNPPLKRKSMFKKKVNLGDLAIFSRQLAAMINAGIPVTRSLFVIGQQSSNTTLKNALITISQDVESGRSLTDAFKMHPEIFSELYVSMLHSGEMGGILEEALTRLSLQFQKEKAIKDNLRASSSYPGTVIVFAMVLFICMVLFIVPTFKGLIPADADIPAITALIFIISDSLRNRWYLWITILTVIAVFMYLYVKSPKGKLLWEKIKLRLPVFGSIVHKAILARFSRTLASLLEGGIPVIQAIQEAGNTSGSILVQEAIKESAVKIEQGGNISDSLKDNYLFPLIMIQMITVGEESGRLTYMLDKVAEFYEDEVETMSKRITALIEPVMLVVVGLIIGIMLIALYVPIFSVISQLGWG
jgi:type IV pilus assembly protein PilC